jgi:hypothetical protein
VSVDDQVYALTYGVLGRFFIAADRIDPGFGIQFALRAVEPDRINRVTRRVLASTGRVDRNLVPGGQPIRRYDMEGWGEIVRQLSGVLTNERLTVAKGSADVGLAVPTSLVELEPHAGSYVVKVPYRKQLHPVLDLDAVTGRARGRGDGRRLNALKLAIPGRSGTGLARGTR